MKLSDPNRVNPGTRLVVTFVFLMILILGGNALVLWQFNSAQAQTDRLVGANQQMTAVLQLQLSLLSFHRRLDDLALSRQYQPLAEEANQLRRTLYEETERTRGAVARLPLDTPVNPALWPTLEAIEIILPSQLDAITELARSGDWEAARLRLTNQLKPIESQTAILVNSVDRQANQDLAAALARMRAVRRRTIILVPATAMGSFLITAFFGWSIARRITEVRFNERVTERLRIARELHDTLLQTIQASRMVAATALDASGEPNHHRPALVKLSGWLDQAMCEAREALNSLRTSTTDSNHLAEALRRAIAEFRQESTAVSFSVIGDPRALHSVVQDELCRIGYEAIRNACEHAHASQLEVELTYAKDVALRVKDNGVGIDAEVIDKGRTGHFGLQGMRERASQIGGELTFVSAAVSGTEVKLVVPGGIVFRNALRDA